MFAATFEFSDAMTSSPSVAEEYFEMAQYYDHVLARVVSPAPLLPPTIPFLTQGLFSSQERLAQDVVDALWQEVDALSQVLDQHKVEDGAMALEEAEAAYNDLVSLHLSQGIDVVALRASSLYAEDEEQVSDDEDAPSVPSFGGMTCSESQLLAAVAANPSFDYMEAADAYVEIYGVRAHRLPSSRS